MKVHLLTLPRLGGTDEELERESYQHGNPSLENQKRPLRRFTEEVWPTVNQTLGATGARV